MSGKPRIWLFGDDVNTDLIIPGRYLDSYDPAHLASHAMEGANKDFAAGVSEGDIIVAGRNFGCGSSREQAVIALKRSGVQAIVAKSFARIFYRNAINLGLRVIVSGTADSVFKDGDSAVLEVEAGTLASIDGSKMAALDKIPEHVRVILDHGGLIPHIKAKLGKK
jgi:3-isopropylmalate dehydratase small subunit